MAAIKKDLALKVHSQEMAEDSSEDSSQDARRKKKARTTFTGRQIFELEKQFEVKKYLSSSERAEMAKLLNVTETQVSTTEWRNFIQFELVSKFAIIGVIFLKSCLLYCYRESIFVDDGCDVYNNNVPFCSDLKW